MFIIFDQEYNTKLYAREYAIIVAVETYKEVGKSIEETVNRIAEKFNLDKNSAERYVNDVWENKVDSNEEEDYGWAL